MEADPQQGDTKAGDPPKEEHEGSQNANPERQGPDLGSGPADAPDEEPGDANQGPSGPPPDSIPGDSGQVPNPSQN